MNDFQLWLKKNSNHLRAYTPDEIARLAFFCGFEIKEVCGPIIDQVIHIKRLMTFWESPLSEKWMRATECERGQND